MSYSVVVTKVDPELKKQAQAVAKKLEIPLSVAIRAYLIQFVKTKTIVFSANDDYLESITK